MPFPLAEGNCTPELTKALCFSTIKAVFKKEVRAMNDKLRLTQMTKAAG